ncbi:MULTISPECIES: hypothetical protein [unclassified Aureimonas]|uniref:hypothetical protein n=1 Tax=unclassified Aureimonas TaxID=2615206 RepID=UPI0006F92E0B|nr:MULTISPECIES: hypothetical protein [unclassified Aureimonas]KQT63304.1 hypothetical protein ASG62_22515 [Aureimonas sp. Leaf427]KQT80116.1 hypothetical protein ASG54_08250 [Aureimonas sp. Leaf460]
MLEARPDEQSRQLRESPELRRELSSLMLALNRRLSLEDRSILHASDIVQISKTLGVTPAQAAQLRWVQVRGVQAERMIPDRLRFRGPENLSLER